MPHLTKLQEQYKDSDVTFISVSNEELSVIEPFLEDEGWGEKMGFTVATDPDNSTNEAYLEAAGERGIPAAFIVGREGQIEWIGHPMTVDKVIEQVVNDSWDREKFAQERKVAKEQEEKAQAAMEKLNEAYILVLDEATAEEGYKMLREHIKPVWDNAGMLNMISWSIMTDESIVKRDYDVALEFAQRAVELTEEKQASILDTLARAYYEKGDLKKAVEVQTKAVAVASEEEKPDLEATLEKYKDEAGGGGA